MKIFDELDLVQDQIPDIASGFGIANPDGKIDFNLIIFN